MIVPVQKDDVLAADIEAAAADAGSDRMAFWWLGQSGFLVVWNGARLLFDPYLSDSLTRKYAATDKPHVRMTARAVAPDRLRHISLVTSSHVHTDHLDAETLIPLAAANPDAALVMPEANIPFARERLADADELRIAGLDAGASVSVGPFTVTGIAAAHNEIERDAAGRCRFLGFAVSFGPFRIFHSGDTLWHDSLVAEVFPHRPDVAFLPINGNRPERRVAGNMNGTEAAAFARAVNARLAVPCHYHMFEFNTEPPDEFEAACRRLGQRFLTLRCGERAEYSAPPESRRPRRA